jgi:glycyl-tRNA synthetase beta chain
MVFHTAAGTMLDRTMRMESVAALLAGLLEYDVAKAQRAGLLAKADLVTETVGEFPELQGTIGRLLALRNGEDEAVANAIGEQYQPAGPDDRVPCDEVPIVLALSEKIDSLATLWLAGEKPSGSRDPFALRRAALGILRIVLHNDLRLPLLVPLSAIILLSGNGPLTATFAKTKAKMMDWANVPDEHRGTLLEILGFLADRLKIALRGEGVRHDLIDAVFELSGDDDFVRLAKRVKALEKVLGTSDGANLLTAYRRAANILRIEEKRDGRSYEGAVDTDTLALPEEKDLFQAMMRAEEQIVKEIGREHYTEAMEAMAGLREPVDRFFDRVTVNAPDAQQRENRLLLLSGLRRVLHTVADFSRIEG